MPFTHGRNAAVYLGDSAGTQRNLTPFVDSVDVSWDADASETTVLGVAGRTYIQGLYTGTISLSGKWDNAGTATPDQWLSGLITAGTVTPAWVYAPGGSASGRPFESGSGVVTNYTVAVPVDDVVTWSASVQVTGAITRGTF
jgi:hypothetical protein